jgi:hypothetical protein
VDLFAARVADSPVEVRNGGCRAYDKWGSLCVFTLRELVMDGELAICFGFMCGVAENGDGSR